MLTGSGRPLRFVAMVGTLWIGGRVATLWYVTGSLPQAIERTLPVPRVIAAATRPVPVSVASRHATLPRARRRPVATAVPPTPTDPIRAQLALLAMVRFGAPIVIAATDTQLGSLPAAPLSQAVRTDPAAPDQRPAVAGSRWSTSGWLIVRPGSGASLGAPQLGGSQAGARIDYALGHGFALTGRIATPLHGAGREMALGASWQPARLPVRVIAEQRIALDQGRDGPSLAVAGGLSNVALPAGFRLEGYAQGGVIARRGGEAYADGLARATQPVASHGRADIDMGIGAWGAAQRGATRLDLGPTAGLSLPVANRAIRLTLDWRQRVAGDARPGSGPALSLGSEF